jgi:hypothetical protein
VLESLQTDELTAPGYFTSDADLITPNTTIYGDSMATDWNRPDYAYGYEVPMDIRVDLDSLRQRALLYGATPVPMHDSYSGETVYTGLIPPRAMWVAPDSPIGTGQYQQVATQGGSLAL